MKWFRKHKERNINQMVYHNWCFYNFNQVHDISFYVDYEDNEKRLELKGGYIHLATARTPCHRSELIEGTDTILMARIFYILMEEELQKPIININRIECVLRERYEEKKD